MSNKEHIHSLYNDYGIQYKQSDSYENLVLRLENTESPKINISIIKDYHRNIWKPAPIELHLTNLKSGLLKGIIGTVLCLQCFTFHCKTKSANILKEKCH